MTFVELCLPWSNLWIKSSGKNPKVVVAFTLLVGCQKVCPVCKSFSAGWVSFQHISFYTQLDTDVLFLYKLLAGCKVSREHACLTASPWCVRSRLEIYAVCVWSCQWNELRLYSNCSLNDLTSVSVTTCSIDGWNTYRMFQDHSLLVMVEQAFSPAPCRSQPAICMETRCMVSRCAVTTCVETDTQPLCSNVCDFMWPVSEET